jgi:hypothetical protein
MFPKLSHRLECMVSSIAFSEICQHFRRILVYRTHHADLAIAFLDVFLIDTDCINPYDKGSILVSHCSQRSFQIFRSLEVLRTDLDSTSVTSISLGIWQGFILRLIVKHTILSSQLMGPALFSRERVRSSVFPSVLRRARNIYEWTFLLIFPCLSMNWERLVVPQISLSRSAVRLLRKCEHAGGVCRATWWSVQKS